MQEARADRRKKEGGNGRQTDRRTGVDRRIVDLPAHDGPERRQRERRRPERAPDKPIKP